MSVNPRKGYVQCKGGCNLYYPPDADYCGWCEKPLPSKQSKKKGPPRAAPSDKP
jgi:hypothetical protein